jgi:prolyl-tRNA synthetase
MNVNFVAEDGSKKPIWFGSYGIGITRVLGTLVEVGNDEKGIIWNPAVSPFDVHLLSLNKDEEAKKLYDELQSEGFSVLFDDRSVPAGEKFGDSDLIGIPVRLVVSEKTGEGVEYKVRTSSETQILSKQELLQKLHE